MYVDSFPPPMVLKVMASSSCVGVTWGDNERKVRRGIQAAAAKGRAREIARDRGQAAGGGTWMSLAASSSTFGFLTSEPSLPGTKLTWLGLGLGLG